MHNSYRLIPSPKKYKSMKKVFIGIDFSKLKFDVAIYSVETKAIVATEVFENDTKKSKNHSSKL